jgi:dTDP-4-dehydrorhamnose reductase
MIWLIGNKGMLGTDVELSLIEERIDYIATDADVDITDINSLRTNVDGKGISWIINCSAYTAVDKAEEETEIAFSVNGDGVRNIATVAREKDAPLIHISTDYVYKGDIRGEYMEEDETAPLSIYGKSKLCGEQHLRNEWGKHFIFRLSWLYGLHGNNFIYTMLRLFKEKDEVRVVADQHGSPTYT